MKFDPMNLEDGLQLVGAFHVLHTETENYYISKAATRVSDALLDFVKVAGKARRHADVILFRRSGKYYTDEQWEIPENALGPYSMINSPDFRRIDGGPVLIPSQEPWGFPCLFPGVPDED